MHRLSRRGLLAAVPFAALSLGTAALAGRVQRMARPATLDLSLARTTDKALYKVRLAPEAEPVRVRRIHSWTMQITTPSGRPVGDARVTVDGGMPEHGHGLPTTPRARPLGDGNWTIEGMKFSMSGWWVIDLAITTDSGTDTVRFNYIV